MKEMDKAILIEIIDPSRREISMDSFEEFKTLVKTLNIEIVAETTQIINKPNYAFFIGKGKLNEIKQVTKLVNPKYVFINAKLTYLQLKNISKEIGVPCIDRPHLILMIFSMRAKTREGKLQIELSELKMRLPEIVHSKTYLDQQVGSEIGLKGPGEKMTEVKRRYVEKRIKVLEKKLRTIALQRALRRKKRRKSNIPIIAIVGYTNSGKSTLLNQLTHSNAYTENMLFSTLDTLVREGNINDETKVLFVDTIGFIRDLPPTLIYAFHSTLEEILDAWIIIHLVDISVPDFREKIDSVLITLNKLKAADIPRILVFNKIDKIPSEELLRYKRLFKEAIFISAIGGRGLDELKERLRQELSHLFVRQTLLIPYSKPEILAMAYRETQVIDRKNGEKGIYLSIEGFKANVEKFQHYFTTASDVDIKP